MTCLSLLPTRPPHARRFFLHPSYLTGLLIATVLFSGCSQPEPVAPAVPATPVVVVPDQPPAIEPAPLVTSETDVKSTALFREYLRHLRAGDFIQADASYKALTGQFRGEDLSHPFWEENLPSDYRLKLVVATVCAACPDGACTACRGKGECPVCEGSGLCKTCEGRGGEWKPCTRCICQVCRGVGLCTVCQGRGQVPCSSCKGSGNGNVERRFETCGSCKGLGYKEGLLRGDGTRDRVTCLMCKGSRGSYSSIRHPCQTCGGTGRQPCGACAASGRCATCKGAGRTAACPVCNGAGRYLEPCPVCEGEKLCRHCRGSKRCPACNGQGKCAECQGRGASIRYRLPVDRRWLARPDATLTLYDRLGLNRSTPSPGALTATINGRTVSLEAPAGTVLWLSTIEDLRRGKELFIPQP